MNKNTLNDSIHSVIEESLEEVKIIPPKKLEKTSRNNFSIEVIKEHSLYEVIKEVQELGNLPASLVLPTILSSINIVTQKNYDIMCPFSGDIKPISLGFITILESGGGKSRCFNLINKKINEIDKEEIIKYNNIKDKSDEKIIKSNFIVRDVTIEGLIKKFHSGAIFLGLLCDEAGQFFGGYSMKESKASTISILSKLLDNGCVDKVRNEEDISIVNKRFCMHLMIQPKMAKHYLFCPQIEDQGFLSRMLISFPESNIGKRKISLPKDNKPSEIMEKFYQIQGRIYANDTKYVLKLSDESNELFKQFAQEIEDKMGDYCEYYNIRNYVNKMSELSIRIAANLYIYDIYESGQSNMRIEVKYIVMASEICTFFCNEILKIKEINHNNDKIYKFVRWLYTKYHSYKAAKSEEEELKISVRNIKAHYAPMKNSCKSSEITRILNQLVEEGWMFHKENNKKQFILSRYIWQKIQDIAEPHLNNNDLSDKEESEIYSKSFDQYHDSLE